MSGKLARMVQVKVGKLMYTYAATNYKSCSRPGSSKAVSERESGKRTNDTQKNKCDIETLNYV